jgi:hypothetical protein
MIRQGAVEPIVWLTATAHSWRKNERAAQVLECALTHQHIIIETQCDLLVYAHTQTQGMVEAFGGFVLGLISHTLILNVANTNGMVV